MSVKNQYHSFLYSSKLGSNGNLSINTVRDMRCLVHHTVITSVIRHWSYRPKWIVPFSKNQKCFNYNARYNYRAPFSDKPPSSFSILPLANFHEPYILWLVATWGLFMVIVICRFHLHCDATSRRTSSLQWKIRVLTWENIKMLQYKPRLYAPLYKAPSLIGQVPYGWDITVPSVIFDKIDQKTSFIW